MFTSMHSTSSPSLPFPSDPALLGLDDWEEQLNPLKLLPSSTNSDDFEALRAVQEETTARKNKEGVVIQHRAWPLGEAFRSEADYPLETPLRSRNRLALPPSSPPILKMASSPIAYPNDSSPPPAKRPMLSKPTKPRKSKTIGGFLSDDSDPEDEFSREEPAPKRRMLDDHRSPSPDTQQTTPEFAAELPKQKTAEDFMLDDGKLVDQDREGLPVATSRSSPAIDSIEEDLFASLPSFLRNRVPQSSDVLTCSGKSVRIQRKQNSAAVPFEQLVASRSNVKAGRAKKSYYGIDIHQLIDDASKEAAKDAKTKAMAQDDVLLSVESGAAKSKPRRSLMWTEKYRARNFLELVGDDRTHRQVLRWLKAWDPIVFPGSGKAKPAVSKRPGADAEDEKAHRKILLLTGPPGLGKTTLAHVCARQAGYEVMEINASDERSRDVVKGRIRTSVGTESVKTGATVTSKNGQVRKNAHPLCVVVDEVDGVVGGSGGSGEGGFIKALIDLILLDQKNSAGGGATTGYTKKKKKGDDFRLMRPLILICNDVYHPALRPLRQSSFAEIIHIRKPPLDAVVDRMKSVFEKEGVSCDSDAVRRLCEATWGVTALESRKGREGTGEGDLRGIMVVGEWAAGKLKASQKDGKARLTRKWVEKNMLSDLSHSGGGARGAGRGGVKELVNRVFLEGAGFPKDSQINHLPNPDVSDTLPKTQLGVSELAKKAGMERLGEMVETSGDIDRIITDIFSEYPNQPFNDDNILSKPDAAYEWLHFHDTCSSMVFSNQAFELAPYLSQPVLACHHLFSSPARHYFGGQNDGKKWGEEEVETEPLPFSGPRADYAAHEASKFNRDTILTIRSGLNPTLLRGFRSPEDIATDLLPYLVRILTPEIKPIIVGGSGDQRGIASVRKESEKAMVRRAVDVMGEIGVIFERGKLEGDFGSRATQWVYRMEPPLDTLVTFETASMTGSAPAPVRYGVRQVLDQEYQKNIIVRENAARQARYKAGNPNDEDMDYSFSKSTTKEKNKKGHHHAAQESVLGAKRDFFGRVINEPAQLLQEIDGNGNVGKNGIPRNGKKGKRSIENKVWVSFHEGFSNAVRKPMTVEDLLRGL